MLTNDDFNKLKRLIRDENEELKTNIYGEIKLARMRLEDRIYNIDERVRNLEKTNAQILKEIKKLKRDINDGIGFNDKNVVRLEKRVKIIEVKLNLETPDFAVV